MASAGSVHNYVRGETNPRVCTVATAQVIGTGDICSYESNTLIRAEDFTWTTDLATTQTNFALQFAGVSAQRKRANEARPGHGGGSKDNQINVSSTGVFRFKIAAADAAVVYQVGELVGPAKAAGDALLSDTVAKVAGVALAIGRVEEIREANSVLEVKIAIVSKLFQGGPQA